MSLVAFFLRCISFVDFYGFLLGCLLGLVGLFGVLGFESMLHGLGYMSQVRECVQVLDALTFQRFFTIVKCLHTQVTRVQHGYFTHFEVSM